MGFGNIDGLPASGRHYRNHAALPDHAARSLRPPWNCSSSVEPVSAVVDDCALLDRLGHRVEVAGTDLALVLDRSEATLGASNSASCNSTNALIWRRA